MTELKTQVNDADVMEFLHQIEDEAKQKDALRVLEMMKEITGEPAKMWGKSIVGFGTYHYKYASGREGDWMATAFSPRKANLTIYIMPGFEKYPELMEKLGKYKTGRSCLYLKKLEDVDEKILRKLIKKGYEDIRKMYPRAS